MNQESLDTTERIQSLNSQWPEISSRRHRRIRRLVETDNRTVEQRRDTQQPSFCRQLQRYVISACLIILVLAVFVGQIARQNENRIHLLNDFLRNYREQYREIISKQRNLCNRTLNTEVLFSRIREERILHQENALLQLELVLRNNTRFFPIALVGPPGVGKSLVARALMLSFPWHKNVHSYAWNTYVQYKSERTDVIQMIADRLSECGRNLVVIDNLLPRDKHIVPCLNKIFLESVNSDIPKEVTVFYIFTLNKLQELNKYRRQYTELQNIPNTTTINFHSFGPEELKDCITRDALLENITLSVSDIKELMDAVDVSHSGCKNVRAKLLIVYGRRKHP